MAEGRPVEEIIHNGLVLRDELVEFVHQDDAGNAPWRRMGELVREERESV